MCTNTLVKIVFAALFEIVKAKMQATLYSSENKVEKLFTQWKVSGHCREHCWFLCRFSKTLTVECPVEKQVTEGSSE